MSEEPLGKKYTGGREVIIRYSGEVSAGGIIRRLLKLAASDSGKQSMEGSRTEGCQGDEAVCENEQGSGLCQGKQG